MTGDGLVDGGEAVAADDFASVGVVDEEVEVVGVEAVEVERFARAFADTAEGQLSEAADLAEGVGDFASTGEVDGEGAAGGQGGGGREGGDFGGDEGRVDGGDE